MRINLRAKSKLGFVLGTCRRSDYQMEFEEQWEKCNCFVLAWIMNTVSKELFSGLCMQMMQQLYGRILKSDLTKSIDQGSINFTQRSVQFIKAIQLFPTILQNRDYYGMSLIHLSLHHHVTLINRGHM